ncbi:MAG: HAMP domain-containing sensor histidine kinase [Clostridiales bacterium]|nr:HAMP domain-containing sensor histidine kinase [Clostridiales bacterium]
MKDKVARQRALKNSFWVRFGAFFLFLFSLVILASAVAGLAYMIPNGYYSDNGESDKKNHLYRAGYYYVRAAANEYVFENYSQLVYTYGYYASRTANLDNIDYSIVNADTRELLFSDVEKDRDYLLDYTETLKMYIASPDSEDETIELDFEITVYLRAGMDSPDWCINRLTLLNFLSRVKYLAIGAAAVFLPICSALFIFLMQSAGLSADGTPTPGFLGKLPIEVFAILIAGLAGLSFLLGEVIAENSYYSTMGVLVLIAFWTVLALWLLMSISARFRSNTFFRYSLTWLIIRLTGRFWRWVFRIYHKAGFLWRSAVTLCASALVFLFALILAVTSGKYSLLVLQAIVCAVLYSVACANLSKLRRAVERLAAGDYTTKVSTVGMFFDCRRAANNINRAGDGLNRAVEEQIKSERLKTELITNVSHDIKTPLTSIVNCADLLKSTENLSEQGKEYLEILDRQSRRLKKLTEDILEASKASTGNIKVELAPVDLGTLLSQAIGEYSDKFNARNLKIMLAVTDDTYLALADGKLLWRVFDNLFSNIVKYALPGTRVYLDIGTAGGSVFVNFRNISEFELPASPSELMERFVRGDSSRHTEGSGLGFSIAQNLCVLMGGKLSLSTEADLFKATVSLPGFTPPSAALPQK